MRLFCAGFNTGHNDHFGRTDKNIGYWLINTFRAETKNP